MNQLQLKFPDPPGFEDLARYVGQNIARREGDLCIVLARPYFDWSTGTWQCLANLRGTLALIQLRVVRKEAA